MENFENNNVNPETEENTYGQDFASYQTAYVSKEEFLKNHEKFNKTIKTTAIVSYVLVGINVLGLLLNPFVILDIAILLGCTLGVHLKKKKGCAIAILVYGIFSVIVGLLSSAGPTGWMWIVIAIIYLNQFKKAENEYKAIYGGQI